MSLRALAMPDLDLIKQEEQAGGTVELRSPDEPLGRGEFAA
jgi:hypothetical protein